MASLAAAHHACSGLAIRPTLPAVTGITCRPVSSRPAARTGVLTRFRRGGYLPVKETIKPADRIKLVELQRRFEACDADHNGRIDINELRSLLEGCCGAGAAGTVAKHWLSEREVARVMRRYDLDGSGDLSAHEFRALVADGLLLDEKLADFKAVFASVDSDRSGDISPPELAAALQRLGWQHSAAEVAAMMDKAGTNEAGNLDFTAFMALMRERALDVSEVLAYLGARPESPETARAVIHAVAHEGFANILSEDDLEAALLRAGERLVVLLAATTWCSASRALVPDLKELAAAYPGVDFLMVWGNTNAATRALFRDGLQVRSTPAFFLFRQADCVCHGAGWDVAKLEKQLRRRCSPMTGDVPALPVFASCDSSASDSSDSDWE